jgi:hypothetical protein
VRGLEKIFSPAVVYAMSDTEVEVIASEVVCQAPEGIINLGTGSSSSSTCPLASAGMLTNALPGTASQREAILNHAT